ncbi:mechanosensitive ion channel family protein [Sandaracinus amylolyticus]|uniref:Membrane protein n=1 Tax=Sandaracinus amylolyticus TaxID=927083 RepID=A0A0F6YM79_9BACT|nr:mechanosensitive ion channel domain-containing protein [Sandaracinus amylolyticus]AKF11078.1 Membrane protein [Sandaracinus amylolyticus]
MSARCELAVVAALWLSVVVLADRARAQEPAPLELETADDEPSIDHSTPRRLLASFLASARDGEWDVAAHALDLREVPRDQRAEVGREAARDLEMVLSDERVLPTTLPDEPEPGGDRAVEILRLPTVEQGVVLRRVRGGEAPAWKFSAATVRAAPLLAEGVDRGPIGSRTPEWLHRPRVLQLEPWQWIVLPIALLLALGCAFLTDRITSAIARRFARRLEDPFVDALFERLRGPKRAALSLAFLGIFAIVIRFSRGAIDVLGRAYVAGWSLAVGWAFWHFVDLVAERVEERAATEDHWRARGVRTRAGIVRRVLHVAGVVVTIAVVLLQFDVVREIGVSLLASAGVAGIVLGIAAQRTLGNLFAGMQLSFSQPLRVGDEIAIEGETGTVEEINLSYVVLRLWDRRRLILPIPKLLETPFENWTRLGTDIVGVVLVPVDFTTPFAALRVEVERYVRDHPRFDGATLAVQVIAIEDRTATLRVLVSAADSGALVKLQCDVREHVLGVLQTLDGGRYLPRVRLEEGPAPDGDERRATLS